MGRLVLPQGLAVQPVRSRSSYRRGVGFAWRRLESNGFQEGERHPDSVSISSASWSHGERIQSVVRPLEVEDSLVQDRLQMWSSAEEDCIGARLNPYRNLIYLAENPKFFSEFHKRSRQVFPKSFLDDDFTSAEFHGLVNLVHIHRIMNGSIFAMKQMGLTDHQDEDVVFEKGQDLLQRCQQETSDLPPLMPRHFQFLPPGENSGSQGAKKHQFRVFQWNLLAQALALYRDKFVLKEPERVLNWDQRRWRILEEILTRDPDIICCEEVDHFKFLEKSLGCKGYRGSFLPKPDSPCIYVDINNGPDGAAIFFRASKFELVMEERRVIEVWKVQSNQVLLVQILRHRESGREICVAATHLKARDGALLSAIRKEEGVDLMKFLKTLANGRPVIICGDFNAVPTEPVISAILQDKTMALDSAYRHLCSEGKEPPFTTWKIREDGESCKTLDYIFYSKQNLEVRRILNIPTEETIGNCRLPSLRYPSDHLSLCCDFEFSASSNPKSSSSNGAMLLSSSQQHRPDL
ncbi:unnamed protein product [Cyprideis torosa]|uniref:Nocturnin n=1 Tax=Cyprideis torosa TaxID=163714 RepID=A0A7R8WGE0_9CRUS|nr:unnamed protein product [Cyprideis torosa]CAG0898079.1 unnamed protein product [Cyprideis torosa]